MDGGDLASTSACVEEEEDLFASHSPQSGKTTGMSHVAENVAVVEGDPVPRPGPATLAFTSAA